MSHMECVCMETWKRELMSSTSHMQVPLFTVLMNVMISACVSFWMYSQCFLDRNQCMGKYGLGMSLLYFFLSLSLSFPSYLFLRTCLHKGLCPNKYKFVCQIYTPLFCFWKTLGCTGNQAPCADGISFIPAMHAFIYMLIFKCLLCTEL